jgi:serine/threonine protein kinase/tetratricopeptide (TPR) repeat protein
MTPDRLPPPNLPTLSGERVSHYHIGDQLGAGGMGEVYRAKDTRLGRDVALKFLRRGHDDPSERARLLREARAASSLRSSNIAAIYDLGEHETRPFIVMELVDGEALSARIARGPLGIAEAVAIAAQAADALDEAHQHGIIHRDIKSANLMVDQRGRVKLLDFGLARFVEQQALEDLTRTGVLETVAGAVMGTFAYMSPEQVRGRPLDARTDLFSLGVVLYEMIAGRLPFDGATVTEVADRILNHEPPALARFNYDVPEALEGIVLKALEKDAAFRYQSARELFIDLHHLSRVLDGSEEAARSDSGNRAPIRAPGRTRSGRTSGPFDASPRSSDHAGSVAEGVRGGPPSVAVMTFSNTTRAPADDWIGSGIAETVTSDLKSIAGITVIGRAQVFDAIKHLSGSDLAQITGGLAIDIGRRIGATFIVGGGYQRLGPMIRITVECVDVRTGELKRTLKVDGNVDDLFSLQDRLVAELRKGLAPSVHESMPESSITAAARRETDSLEAYQAFSRGVMNLRLATPESLLRAIALFEEALGVDPRYASAWAALGTAYHLQGQFLGQDSLIGKAIEALERAVALDATNGLGLASLGAAYGALGRLDESRSLLERALASDPGNFLARMTLARLSWIGLGRFDEGIALFERALECNPEAGYVHQQLALLHSILGRLDRAEHEAQQAVALQEALKSGAEGLSMIGSFVRFGYVRYLQGRYDEAVHEYERERAWLTNHDHALRERVLIEIGQKTSAARWRAGDVEAANRAFDETVRAFRARQARGATDPFTSYYLASLYALRGQVDEAVALVDEAAARLPVLTRARIARDPDFDPIRAAPALIERLGSSAPPIDAIAVTREATSAARPPAAGGPLGSGLTGGASRSGTSA